MSRLGRFLALPGERRALLLEAGWSLLVATWQVRRWRFSRLAASLGTQAPAAAPSPLVATPPATEAGARDVRWALSAWTRAWPWPPTCLMQATAGRRMLVARGLAGELYFGVRGVASEATQPASRIGAHAWLRCAGIVVTGEAEAQAFRPIAVYRFTPAGAAPPP